MATAFNPGDVVRLKSGGPKMTVEFADEDDPSRIICSWFVKETVQQRGFASAALEVVPPDEPSIVGGIV